MRLLRFDFRDDLSSVDLHPLITVVSNLKPAHKRQLFEAVRRLSNGSTLGLRGLIEHQGLLVELDAGAGDPLGSVATSATVLAYVDGPSGAAAEVGLQAEIDQWERQAAIDAVSVEEIRSDLNLALKARTSELRRLVEPGFEAEGGHGASPRKLMIATIRRAFEEAIGHEPEISQCDPAIPALLQRWEQNMAGRQEAEEHLSRLAAEAAEAERLVRDRTRDLDIATKAAKPVFLNTEQEARLEELCDASSASDSPSRLGLWKRSFSNEDEAERRALLDLVGVRSWTEYSVFRLSPTVSADRLAAVSRAEAALGEARATLDGVRARHAADPIASALDNELERIKVESQPFLGVVVPSDIGAVLREQIVRVENPDWTVAINHLRDALSSNDLHPPYGLEPQEILGWTDSWLRAQESLDESGDDDDDGDGSVRAKAREQDLLQAAEAVAADGKRLARHHRALSQIDKAEQDAARSAHRVRELEEQLQSRSTGPQITTADEVLALVSPIAEQVLLDVGGSLPIVVVGDMAGLVAAEVEAMMGALEEVAEQVQVILVTGHGGITDWVLGAGLERASVAAEAPAPL